MTGARHRITDLVAGTVVLLVAALFVVYAAVNTGRGSTSDGMRLSARFENVGSLSSGSEVRVGGVKVGAVTGLAIDVKTFQAIVSFTVQRNLVIPSDSSVTIASAGLLGGAFLNLGPGGSDTPLRDGGSMAITQSASNLEDLLGKFIFNVGNLADATQKTLQQKAAKAP